ncbi:hypothetical protein D3C76_1029160 [compost metagenome]
MLLDVVLMLLVVAYAQLHAGLGAVGGNGRCAGEPRLGIAANMAGFIKQAQAGAVQVGDNRPAHLYCVILLGHGPEIEKVIGRIVDPADKRRFTVDHHDLAVHAPKQVGAHTQQLGAGVECLQAYAGFDQRLQELRA